MPWPQIGSVSIVIDESSRSGRLPAIGQLGAPGFYSFNFSVGDRLLASETAAQLDQHQVGYYVSVSAAAASMRAATAEELADWSDLYTIVGPGRRFGVTEQAHVRAALSRAVGAAKRLKLSAQNLTAAIAEAGLITSQEITAERRRAGGDYAQAAREGIMCKPLAEAPRADSYGQAPSPVDLLQVFRP